VSLEPQPIRKNAKGEKLDEPHGKFLETVPRFEAFLALCPVNKKGKAKAGDVTVTKIFTLRTSRLGSRILPAVGMCLVERLG